ncbi:MAG: CRTAC1 family protein, partial [Anaerolineae bacterium]
LIASSKRGASSPSAPVPRDPLPTEAAAWGDFNNDGYLDLYAANHVDWDVGTCFDDYLWLNEGPPDYTFRDASVASGVRAATLCGRGVNAADFDDDGDTDIYVSNYRLNRDLLWVNDGVDLSMTPRFINQARERGVEGTTKMMYPGSYGHTIGSVWGDIDNDADQDLVASRLAHSAWRCFSDTTSVYASQGADAYVFDDVRAQSGVEYVETHSDASLVDFDNDGYLDLHITHVYDGWRSSTYRNVSGDSPLGRGIEFENVTHLSGIYPRTSWGSGWADYDLDGDMDLAARGLWRNRATSDSANGWLQVVAQGCGGSNRDAVGTKVRLFDESGELIAMREVYNARGTGSQDSRVQHFGLGEIETVKLVQVEFPSGQTLELADVARNQRLSVTEAGAYVVPDRWMVRAGEELHVRADTCGEDREVRWDLDDDNQYDDATGREITARFHSANPYQPIKAEVVYGEAVGRTRVTVTVTPRSAYLPELLRGLER